MERTEGKKTGSRFREREREREGGRERERVNQRSIKADGRFFCICLLSNRKQQRLFYRVKYTYIHFVAIF